MQWYEKQEQIFDKEKFISLKNGQSVDVVFIGEPYCYYNVYGERPYKEYATKEKEDASFKFRINVYSGNEMKILRGSYSLLKLIKTNLLEYGLNTIFKLKREGEKKETKYHLLFKEKINDETMKFILETPLNNISGEKSEVKVASNNKEENKTIVEDDDIPF